MWYDTIRRLNQKPKYYAIPMCSFNRLRTLLQNTFVATNELQSDIILVCLASTKCFYLYYVLCIITTPVYTGRKCNGKKENKQSGKKSSL